MNEQIGDIIALFHEKVPDGYELKEIRLEENDSRWVLYVDYPGEKYVIKIASNGFTTAERVNGWADIIAETEKLGYYSPHLLKSLKGNYAEQAVFQDKRCIVWEEEFARYHLRESLAENVYLGKDGKYVYHDEVIRFLGETAQKHYTNFPYPSGFVRFEPFSSDDSTDEVTECVETFDSLVKDRAPGFLTRWEKLRALFEENQAQLAGLYHELPSSVFQADLNEYNLLLDENGHFKGVIDYNLAGEDKVLNIFFATILYGYSYQRKTTDDSGVLPELNAAEQESVIAIMLDTLRYLRQYYGFSEIEVKAAPLLFKYVSCIFYEQIDALKKYAGDAEKLDMLFDFMERELRRDDIDFRGAMLGEKALAVAQERIPKVMSAACFGKGKNGGKAVHRKERKK